MDNISKYASLYAWKHTDGGFSLWHFINDDEPRDMGCRFFSKEQAKKEVARLNGARRRKTDAEKSFIEQMALA